MLGNGKLFKKTEVESDEEFYEEEDEEIEENVEDEEIEEENETLPSETKHEISLNNEGNPLGNLKFNYDSSNKSLKEQAKDMVDFAATSKAVEDKNLVKDITDLKKEELKSSASTSLKEEQVKSSEVEKKLQKANYGIYEGIAELIGLKKPLPNKMLTALMCLLIPFLVVYYFLVGFVTGVINITMDCVNSIVMRFAEFTKPAKKIIVFVLILAVAVSIILIIYATLKHYGVIDAVNPTNKQN